MPLIDITNPAVIRFLIESYEKETLYRLNWVEKHRERIEKAATLQREPTNYYETDVLAHNAASGMAMTTRDFIASGYNRMKIRDPYTTVQRLRDLRHGHSIVDVGLGDPKEDPRLLRPDEELKSDPIMRPVDPEVNKIIYKPTPEYGRKLYLHTRAKVWPEKKYYFPECSNWDYGWRTRDSSMHQPSFYGIVEHMTRAQRSRVGPQPDPPHYKSSDLPGPTKFDSI
ncbi:PREDICTED: uncharacterized protein LOC106126736 [Papilio xuthus]|uniref:Uncharacterized protein LOC106126736 n=1 Tax=Papilio xuthus TaxID=66420 RepID=A0AAJ6ZVI7_PAPXU|nr:PREDICTED: uncharacterized protein LOC106126736 [Papilio xuthus]